MMNPDHLGPVKDILNIASREILYTKNNKQWFCGGDRSVAIAAQLIKDLKILAVPTDTIYGLAGLAQNSLTVEKINSIKGRSESKSLAICVSGISDIEKWGQVSHLPDGLLENLLPGPVTIVLKRTSNLNLDLNPGISTVGIRVPDSQFLRNVIKLVGEPLALTSANESNSPSTLHPDEFQSLWPLLDAIFYDNPNHQILRDKKRLGSTIIDLSEANYYKIIRPGMASIPTNSCLQKFGLKRIKERKFVKEEKVAVC